MKQIIYIVIFQVVFFSSFGQEKKTGDRKIIIKKVDSLTALCDAFLGMADLDSAKNIANKLLKYSEEKNYNTGIIQSYGYLTMIYQRQGNNAKAIASTKHAISYIDKTGNRQQMAISYTNIGAILYKDGQYDAALEYMEKANNYFASTKNGARTSILYNISSIYIRMGKPLEEIIQKTEIAEKKARADLDTALIYSVLNNKGLAYVNNSQNINEARDCFKESLRLQKMFSTEEPISKGFSYAGLGDVYLHMKRYHLALQYNDSAIAAFTKMRHKFGLRDAYESRKNILEGKGNYKQAFEALGMLNLLKDTLYDEQRSQQLSQVRTEYETEKKEAEIASLSQQSSIQSLEIRQKNQAIIIGLVVMLFVLSAAYFIYRQRSLKSQQSQTELEQRFLRSQLNPHFISNALMAVQNFMLKNETSKAASYLAKFSKLMREILENSRQEFILVEDEIEMLTNYMDIHKLRMDDAFEYKIILDDTVDPETDTIPPMFVQPFVENAIEHGIVNTKDKGLIELNFVKIGEYISIEIKDNGEGLSSSSQKTDDHTSLSTTIIRERMDLFNKSLKNKIQLLLGDYSNDQGEVLGTKVELKVPFSYL
jgi:tetratricopeptide (TPR) repeat protein